MHQSSSLINRFARLSVPALSVAFPFSSKLSPTFGTGNIAGTVHARIFHKLNCKEVITCIPPKGPLETVEIAMGFLCHSSYKRSVTFFKLAGYPPLYSGVTMI